MTLDAFNTAARDDAVACARACLDIQRWVDDVVDARPYADLASLLQQAGSVAAPFSTAEIDAALVHHPRIGERAQGTGAQARLSAAEQAGLGAGTPDIERALADGNRAYERKFGRVFLIRAAGRGRAEILAELQRRMHNTASEEPRVIAGQLREIAAGRLERLVGG